MELDKLIRKMSKNVKLLQIVKQNSSNSELVFCTQGEQKINEGLKFSQSQTPVYKCLHRNKYQNPALNNLKISAFFVLSVSTSNNFDFP